jgi:hypothetical protein
MATDNSTGIEARHDSIFGIGFYALRLLDEVVVTNLSRGAIGRMVLRTFVECFITLSYLIKKNDPKIWEDFRDYGIGQMKLSYLKARDSKDKPSFVDEEFLKQIINEDRWEEFSEIKVGQWENVREMSVEADCKEIYDAYYDWTSTFSHGNWGAIRESSFARCANPLHRFHLIPSVEVYALPGVLEDVVNITNRILDLIKSQNPEFDCRVTNDPKPGKIPWFKRIYFRLRYWRIQKELDFITGAKS